MIRTVLSLLGMIAIAGLLGVTVPTTLQLAKVDRGLNTSLTATSSLVSIQQSIIQKNGGLKNLASTAQTMEQHLSTTAQTTASLAKNIAAIDTLNEQTLGINRAMEPVAGGSGAMLGGIEQNFRSLSHAMTELETSLQSLDKVVTHDVGDMATMKSYVDDMNAKTPEVP